MKMRFIPLILLLLTMVGCSMRPVPSAPVVSPTPKPTPAPTAPPEYTVTFRMGDQSDSVHVVHGQHPALPEYDSDTHYIVGWQNDAGDFVSPDAISVTEDAVFTAVLRPMLQRNVRFIYADSYGLFRPEALWSRADAARAIYSLMDSPEEPQIELPDITGPEDPRYEACRWFAAMGYAELMDFDEDGICEFGPDQPVDAEYFATVLGEFFHPNAVYEAVEAFPAGEGGLTKATAARWLCRLLELDTDNLPTELPYYPDVPADHEAYSAISLAGAFTGYTAEDFASKTLDGFLWFNGYLYAWNSAEGYFYTDTTLDTLYFDKNGQYTCGNTEVDGYVAALIRKRCGDMTERIKMLESMHKFLRDENRYLVRNHYEAGAEGWEIDEAIIMLSTGKGNCYSFAGALWALGRGLGYNTVVYSGTISKNYDPHGWCEVILDGKHFICDPEIQKQYWAEQKYYDTFMLPYEMATGWQYEAPNREG